MNDRLTAHAQIWLSVLFLAGYFSVLAIFLLGYVKTPVEWKDALTALIGVLTAVVVLICNYWFSRNRTPSQ